MAFLLLNDDYCLGDSDFDLNPVGASNTTVEQSCIENLVKQPIYTSLEEETSSKVSLIGEF